MIWYGFQKAGSAPAQLCEFMRLGHPHVWGLEHNLVFLLHYFQFLADRPVGIWGFQGNPNGWRTFGSCLDSRRPWWYMFYRHGQPFNGDELLHQPADHAGLMGACRFWERDHAVPGIFTAP